MARKYELISELYDRTCKTVVSNPQSWQKFLESACRNYKLRFISLSSDFSDKKTNFTDFDNPFPILHNT